MNSGKLRHKVCIESKVVIRNDYGEEEITWVPFLYAWAEIRPLSGREYFAARQTQAEVTHRLTMRYRSGILAHMRATWNNRTFDIEAVMNTDERNKELVMFATELV